MKNHCLLLFNFLLKPQGATGERQKELHVAPELQAADPCPTRLEEEGATRCLQSKSSPLDVIKSYTVVLSTESWVNSNPVQETGPLNLLQY